MVKRLSRTEVLHRPCVNAQAIDRASSTILKLASKKTNTAGNRIPRIFAGSRPGAMPLPGNRTVSAFTKPDLIARYAENSAGVRAVSAGDNVITMYDDIGENYWTGEGITAKKVTAQLRAIGDRPIEVHINSNGGDMFAGIGIFNILREHPQEITVKVMGLAASAASIIAMAGDKIEIGASAFMMIHECSIFVGGTKRDLREVADWQEQFDEAMIGLYAARTNGNASEIKAWLEKTTFMSGATAIERGFADSLLAADQVHVDEDAKASDRKINDLRAMELTLVAAGNSRTEARARINAIKGTPGASPDHGTPGAANIALTNALAGLLETVRN